MSNTRICRVVARRTTATDDDRADAVARAYHRAFVAEWCQVTTVEDLETLKTDAEGPLCEVCGDLAGRHLRKGADAGNYDTEAPPLCEQLGGSEFIYLSGEPMEGETWVERGKSWCGCRDRCQAGIAGQVVDAESGEPVEGATVEYSADSAVDTMPTDADGNFESDFVACGDYHVRIEAGGYAPADLDVSIEEDGVVVRPRREPPADSARKAAKGDMAATIYSGAARGKESST